MKCRRGITPILAVIILIGVAVVGGALLSSAQNQFLITTLHGIEYQVTDLRLEKDSNGSCFFFVKLYNSGTEPIIRTRINATTNDGEQWFPNDPAQKLGNTVSPSETLDFFEQFTENPCGNFTTSNTYSIGFEAYSASSSYKTIVPLKVKDVIR